MECREAQILLLEPAAPPRSNGHAPSAAPASTNQAQLLAHLAACPECRAMAATARQGEQILTALAAGNARPAQIPNELEQRVRRMAHDRLERSRKAAAGGEIPPRLASRGGRITTVSAEAEKAGWLKSLALPPALAMAAAFALVLAAVVGGKSLFAAKPYARIEFAQGAIQVAESGVEKSYTQIQKALALGPAAKLSTGADGEAFFTLGAATVAMAENSTLSFDRPGSFHLAHGKVWLQVNHTGRGFQIDTPNGTVSVTGTRFGVAAEKSADSSATQTLVEVVEGTVIVSDTLAGKVPVKAGEELTVGSQVGAASGRQAGTDEPDWIVKLASERDVAASLQFLPTFMGKAKKTN